MTAAIPKTTREQNRVDQQQTNMSLDNNPGFGSSGPDELVP